MMQKIVNQALLKGQRVFTRKNDSTGVIETYVQTDATHNWGILYSGSGVWSMSCELSTFRELRFPSFLS